MLRAKFITAAQAVKRGHLRTRPRPVHDVVVYGTYSDGHDGRDFGVRLFPSGWQPDEDATSMYGKHSPYLEEASATGRRIKVFRTLDAVHSFLTVPAVEKAWVINDYKVVWCCEQSDFVYRELSQLAQSSGNPGGSRPSNEVSGAS